MDYFPRKSLSKYLIMDTIDFNKHVHDIDIFINDKWRKYVGGDIGWLFKITRRLEPCFWPTRKRSQPSQGDFFARITLQREPCSLNWKNSLGSPIENSTCPQKVSQSCLLVIKLVILSKLFISVKPLLHLRIDCNFCSVHEEITSIRLYIPCNPHSELRKGVYNLIEVISNEPNK